MFSRIFLLRRSRVLGSIALIGLSVSCHARLGEEEAAISRRFGEPLATVPAPPSLPASLQARLVTRIYNVGASKDGALVEVSLLEGASVREFYFLEKEKGKDGESFNETQIHVILEANGAGSGWESAGTAAWKRKDGAATAKRKAVSPSISLNPKIPLQTQLMTWTGLEVQSKRWDEFLTSAQRELEAIQKQQETEIRRKREQEAEARDLLRGI